MRVFVAVPIPEELRQKIASLGQGIRQEGIKPVMPENMHLTLKFLGEVPPSKIADIKTRLGQIRFQGFECTVKGVGVFPNEDYIRVVWAGIRSQGLDDLAEKVIGSLAGYGKKESFSAHATIARVKRKIDLKKFLEAHEEEEFGSFRVSQFELIQSVLGREGPEYTVLAAFKAEEDA